jgi:hypothetical protein
MRRFFDLRQKAGTKAGPSDSADIPATPLATQKAKTFPCGIKLLHDPNDAIIE